MTFTALITENTDNGYQSRVGERELGDLPEGEALVKVAWSSLNYKDALSASGNKGLQGNIRTRRASTPSVWWKKRSRAPSAPVTR